MEADKVGKIPWLCVPSGAAGLPAWRRVNPCLRQPIRPTWIELTSRCPFDCGFCSRKPRRGAPAGMAPGESVFAAADTPHVLCIELTSRCPFDCGFCSRKLRRGGGRHLPYELYGRLLDGLRAPRRLPLNYSGESLCDPDLIPAIRRACDRWRNPARAGLRCRSRADAPSYAAIYRHRSLAEPEHPLARFVAICQQARLAAYPRIRLRGPGPPSRPDRGWLNLPRDPVQPAAVPASQHDRGGSPERLFAAIAALPEPVWRHFQKPAVLLDSLRVRLRNHLAREEIGP